MYLVNEYKNVDQLVRLFGYVSLFKSRDWVRAVLYKNNHLTDDEKVFMNSFKTLYLNHTNVYDTNPDLNTLERIVDEVMYNNLSSMENVTNKFVSCIVDHPDMNNQISNDITDKSCNHFVVLNNYIYHDVIFDKVTNHKIIDFSFSDFYTEVNCFVYNKSSNKDELLIRMNYDYNGYGESKWKILFNESYGESLIINREVSIFDIADAYDIFIKHIRAIFSFMRMDEAIYKKLLHCPYLFIKSNLSSVVYNK